MLYIHIPRDLNNRIQDTKPLLVNDLPDIWTWKHSYSGQYTTKLAYNWLLSSNDNPLMIGTWSWLWKLQLPANIQFFVWQICHGAIPTRGLLHQRGISTQGVCPRCNVDEESVVHCLFECAHVVHLWNKFGVDNLATYANMQPLEQGVRAIINMHGILSAIFMWVVWITRNQMVFEQNHVPLSSQLMQVLSLFHHINKAYGNRHVSTAAAIGNLPLQVSWIKPEDGWVVLKVDGSALSNPGKSGFGGLVRNADGEFLRGYYGSAGFTHIGHAEILALLHGLTVCKDMGVGAVKCYSNSINTVRMIHEGVPIHHHEANEVVAIKQLLAQDWRVEIYHTYREGNQCADFLAKLGARTDDPIVILHDAPAGMNSLLMADALGVSFPRG